jgi:3-hydroxyacyl-[acyl-carrier-protein] dehydratase
VKNNPINIEKIMDMIPHRYPILLLDRMMEVGDNFAIGLKNVTINEDYFNGHFPGKPIMPGVLIIEALAQTAAAFVVLKLEAENDKKLVYFMSIENAHFRKPVTPGDTLHLHVEVIKNRGSVWKMKGEAKVDGERVADAVFSAMVVDK